MGFDNAVRHIDRKLWLPSLETIFSAMDRAYDRVADAYGFHCRGCADNCCLTRFRHHTLLEYLYLKEGLAGLAPETRQDAMDRAETVAAETQELERQGLAPRIMCPLNREGLCLVYRHRPMICRLHGLAHELRKPGQEPARNEGCGLFTDLTRSMDYIPFDRTPFYMDMALLERKLREVTGIGNRLRHTIAEMMLL